MVKGLFKTDVFERKLEETLTEWKSYGAVTTPKEIIDIMIDLAEIRNKSALKILEPAAGFCNFLFRVYSKFSDKRHEFWGVEINEEVFKKDQELYGELPFKLANKDYLLWEPEDKFDLIIGNPPYGIIGNKSHYPIYSLEKHKTSYKKQFATWHGKFNIYGAFIEKSIALLKKNGKLVFIIPATWMILDDFGKLRKYLSQYGKTKVYYLGKRVFRGIGVSTCILIFEKGGHGAELYYRNEDKFNLSNTIPDWNGSILRFENNFTRAIEENSLELSRVFDIRISARSTEVKNFPKLLHRSEEESVPFLNGRNIRKGYMTRDCFTDLWLERGCVIQVKAFYGVLPRILVGHTKGGKIVAALENELYPYVGDVYHLLPKTKMLKESLARVVDWLNSSEIEKYVMTLYKEITPHITKTQLALIPLEREGKIDKEVNQLWE